MALGTFRGNWLGDSVEVAKGSYFEEALKDVQINFRESKACENYGLQTLR